ncbi:6858_t:CDS:2 [Cetraspora pellucida]|uniref:6858_t:CDS:1 n=1 Tax=Cetraspora pellucida TaxID=1433469 RepID=A0A9N9B2K9_9GLOM|nr:6858_t:CDS:2 [Cetraspora pellucida]
MTAVTQSDHVSESGEASSKWTDSSIVNPDKTEARPAGGTSVETDFSKIDSNTKVYIDTACQASSNTIITAIKLYIDQNNEAHKNMIVKLNEHLDLCFNQIQQTHHQDTTSLQQHDSSSSQEKPSTLQHNHEFNMLQTQLHEKHSSNNTRNQQDQKSIEILSTKPSLSTYLWKTIEVSNYIDLNEFAYTNLKTSLKNNVDKQILQTSEGGIITIYKQNYT